MNKKILSFILVMVFLAIFIIFILVLGKLEDKRACLSLTFDDGLKSHHSVVYPLLKEKNFSATFFIVANETVWKEKSIYGKELMTQGQIKELSDKGFEIGSHTLTHPFLTELTDEEIENELKKSKEFFENKYGIEVESVAFPYGDHDDIILNITQRYYPILRSPPENEIITSNVIYNSDPSTFFLKSFGIENTSEVEDVCRYITYSERNKLWFVIVFHDISENPGQWDTSIEDFKEILDCAQNSGIQVDSLQSCRKEIT